MSLRGLLASFTFAVACTMGGGQSPLDPTTLPGIQFWADSFEPSKLKGPDGQTAVPGGEVSTWVSLRGPLLSGSGSKLVSEAVAHQSAINLGGQPFLSAANLSTGERFTFVAAFRFLKKGLGQTLFQIGPAGGLAVRMGADDRLQVWSGGQLTVSSRQKWNDRDFAVVAIVADGRTTKLFVNGTLDRQIAQDLDPVTIHSGRLSLGNKPDGSEPAKGYLTGLALYQRALSETERRAAEDRFLRALAVPRDTSYVSTVKGTAGAGGLLPSDPLATLNEAVDRRAEAGGGAISIEAPPELPIRGQVVIDVPVPLTLRGIGTRTWSMVAASRYSSGWQQMPKSVYRRPWPLRAVRSVWIESMRESDGLPTALKPASVLASLKPGEFFFDLGYVYLRLPGNVNPNRHIIEIPKETSCLRVANPRGSLQIENGIFRGGSEGAVETGQPTAGGKLFAKNCIAEYGYNGFRIGGQLSEGIYSNCIARRNTNDGFNLHGYLGVNSSMQISKCEAYLNGDEGASPHDDTHMTITGSRLHHNGCSGFMAIGRTLVSLVDVEIDHNGQYGFSKTENGFTSWAEVRGRLLRCDIHDNNGPGVYREATKGVTLTEVSSRNNAWNDR
ncbi:hypothetical protein EON81_00845 [bacterium]|nr:MAG: hypothetical protein EON81_00845 [bacterium]